MLLRYANQALFTFIPLILLALFNALLILNTLPYCGILPSIRQYSLPPSFVPNSKCLASTVPKMT